MGSTPITRRPFLLLSLAIGAAALLHAMFSPALPAVTVEGELPPGTVCTTCGPIPAGGRLTLPPALDR